MTTLTTFYRSQNSWRFSAVPAVLLQCGAAFFLIGSEPAKSDTIFTFGIVPQQSAARLAQVWIPLLDRLEAETGYTFKFATAKDIPTFEACLHAQAYDFAYMNPYHYTVVHETSGYQAFAHQADKKLKGILVARADSEIEKLSHLEGKELAFPSPAAFGASVIPRAELTAENISFKPSYVKSHDSVYRSVALGLFPAGGGVGRTFGNIPEDLKAQLKVFYTTDAYTPHAIAASPNVGADHRSKVAEALLAIEENEILKGLGMKGFVAASDEDWGDVRALQLTDDQTEIVTAGKETCLSN